MVGRTVESEGSIMAFQAGVQYPASLVNYYPLDQDAGSEGDDQIRQLKFVITSTWPQITGAITVDHLDVSSTDGCGNHEAGTINERLERLESGQNITSSVVWFSRHNDLANNYPKHVYPENGTHFWGARIQGATPEYALAMDLGNGDGWVDADRYINANGNAVVFKGSSLFIEHLNDSNLSCTVKLGEYDAAGGEVPGDAVLLDSLTFLVKAIGDGINEAVPSVTFANYRDGNEVLIYNNNCSHWFEYHIMNAEPDQKIWHKGASLVGSSGAYIDTGRVTDRAGNALVVMNSNKQWGSATGDSFYQVGVGANLGSLVELTPAVLMILGGAPTVACNN
jgi:hypothetical protein